jgi:hypothetical protein
MEVVVVAVLCWVAVRRGHSPEVSQEGLMAAAGQDRVEVLEQPVAQVLRV